MKKVSILTLTLILFLSINVLSQNIKLFKPLNIKEAYNNMTRSIDGKPGSKYWQNSSDYKIKTEIDPETRTVFGKAHIAYYNNSPDSLARIVLRLYQDIYKKGNLRDFPISQIDVTEGMIITKLSINNSEIDLNQRSSKFRRMGTNLFIQLSESLSPKQKLDISIDWNFIIPLESSIRMGTYSDSTFFLAYWYPQISVYDDIDGWDVNNYGGQVEFYNDFNNYDVEITVPQNFIVWATGIFSNPDEVLNEEYVERYKSAWKSNDVINIINETDLMNGSITKQNAKNTWKFSAKYVSDFAFALSHKYLWDGVSVDIKGKRVFVDAAYDKESKDFYEVAEIGKNSVKFFSENMPGYPFPYPKITIFNGRGGMEYPMMVNDGSTPTRAGTVGVTSHEIAHTYFPFYMGTNERKYAWMDEGWAVMLPFEFQMEVEGNDPIAGNVTAYERFAGKEMEMPLMIPSVLLNGNSYRMHAYNRSGIAYFELRKVLGDDLFKKALNEYISRWNGKHPIPYDFFYTFNEVTGKDLSWFWNPWFFEFGHPDISVTKAVYQNNAAEVTVNKIGNIPTTVNVKIMDATGEKYVEKNYNNLWEKGDKEVTLKIDIDFIPNRVEIGHPHIPDSDRSNNYLMFQ